MDDFEPSGDDPIKEIAEQFNVEHEEAEEISEIAEELGVDDDDAFEIWSEGGL